MTGDTKLRKTASLRPWAIALALWLLLALISSAALWQFRQDAITSHARELDLLSLSLTDEINRGLRSVEEGLLALRIELQQHRLPLDGASARQALQTRADLMPLVEQLWIVGSDGTVLGASTEMAAPDMHSFAPALHDLPPDVMAVSRPYADGTLTGSLIGLALRLPGVQGARDGWILAAMPASELLGAFTAALPAPDARMGVFRSDGVRLASVNVAPTPLNEATVSRRLANSPRMEVRTFRDGSDNLVGVHSVERYDIKVFASRDLAAVLLQWRELAEGTGIGLALLATVMAAAVHLVQRADRRRTEAQRALDAQLARSSKFESLGTLAGGIAHDFNNVLAGIVGFAEMAQDAAVHGSDQARHLSKVLQAAIRGKALVERVLSFSRGGARLSTVFELEPMVDEVLSLVSASLRPGLVLERAFEAPQARVRGDATQAFEAVLNLCTNAVDAMTGRGMLSVRLDRLHVNKPLILSHSQLSAGDFVALTVSDQGTGISPAVMEHLFEPFFTTRTGRSGTGLGLAVVFGVVTEFGGAIDVRSSPGHGASFIVYFPECKDAVTPAPHQLEPLRGGAGQRLLVVDDDPELVALTEEMLTTLGYAPEGYSDPAAALEALRIDPLGFAALITDEVMPGLSGTQLTQAVRSLAPQMPVLLVSGYGGTLLARRARDAGVTLVLSKPLQRAELSRALAESMR